MSSLSTDILQQKCTEFGSLAALKLLNTNGLNDLRAVFNCGEVMHRRYDAKSVAVASLYDGENDIQVYIKKQWRHSRLIPRMHAFLSGKAFKSYPLREWQGLSRLQGLGLDTAEPLALFRHPWHPFKAAVITRAVPGELSLDQMIESGKIFEEDTSSRVGLAEAIVSVIERIHNAGIGWRSMNIKHFYPVKEDDGIWRIWLIDCEGIFEPVKPRYIERERRAVVKSIRRAGEKDGEIEDFAGLLEQRLLHGLS